MNDIPALPKIALTGNGPRAVGFVRQDRCEKCKWCCPVNSGAPNDPPECRYNPPQATTIMMGAGRGPDGREIPLVNTYASFPRVQPTQWCSKFAPKIEATS